MASGEMSSPATSSPATLALLIFSLNKSLNFLANLFSGLFLSSLELAFFKNERSNFIFLTFSIILVLGWPSKFAFTGFSASGFETASEVVALGVFSKGMFSAGASLVDCSRIC